MEDLGLDAITSPLNVQSIIAGVVSINKTMKLPLNGNAIMDRQF